MKRKQTLIITSIFILCLSVFSGCCFRAKLSAKEKLGVLEDINRTLEGLNETPATDTSWIIEAVVEDTGMLMELEKTQAEASESLDELLEFILK